MERAKILDDIRDCYWFWDKGKTGKVRSELQRPREGLRRPGMLNCMDWNSARMRNMFHTQIEKFNKNHYMNGKWNGQSKAEFDKNYKRVADIHEKSGGDQAKAIMLAGKQAAKITNEFKAINRAMAARQAGHEHIFEVFFQRAYELGTVTKQEYREYMLEKLGI